MFPVMILFLKSFFKAFLKACFPFTFDILLNFKPLRIKFIKQYNFLNIIHTSVMVIFSKSFSKSFFLKALTSLLIFYGISNLSEYNFLNVHIVFH